MGSDRPLSTAAGGTRAAGSPQPARRPPEQGRLVPSYAVPSYAVPSYAVPSYAVPSSCAAVFLAVPVPVAALSKRTIERSLN